HRLLRSRRLWKLSPSLKSHPLLRRRFRPKPMPPPRYRLLKRCPFLRSPLFTAKLLPLERYSLATSFFQLNPISQPSIKQRAEQIGGRNPRPPSQLNLSSEPRNNRDQAL